MTALLLALALQVGGRDPWFGADKVKHFFMTAFVQSVTYGTLRLTKLDHRSSMIGGVVMGAGVGLGRELYDARSKRAFSVRDLVWDAAGAGAATLVLEQVRR